MKILYDYEIMINQRIGGVSRYFKEVITRINKMSDVKVVSPVLFPRSIDVCDALNKKFVFNYPDGAIRILYPINRVLINPFLYTNLDIIHQTQYRVRIPHGIKAKVVVTVHDMIFELFPDSDPGGIKKKQKYAAMMRADAIIAISNTTKRDIIRIYPEIPSDKIHVIHHGMTDFSGTKTQKINGLPEKYILFVGARAGYKNYETFIRAAATILNRDQSINVICTGNCNFNEGEVKLHQDMGIQKQIFWHNCSEDELAYLYQNALCFVYPSIYEGFGLPILEAYSAGCPTVISDTDVFHEIADDASYYFDATDILSISEKLNQVIHSDQIRTKLINAGRDRIKLYSWENTARQTFCVYQSIQEQSY